MSMTYIYNESQVEGVARVLMKFNSSIKRDKLSLSEVIREIYDTVESVSDCDDVRLVGTRGFMASLYRCDNGDISVDVFLEHWIIEGV
jgi:hypothetical protein